MKQLDSKILVVALLASLFLSCRVSADVIESDMPFFGLSMDFRDFGENPVKDNLVPRGIVLPLGDDVYACFDTDLLRIACVWQAEPGKPPIDYQSVATFSYENTNKKAPGGQNRVSKPLGRPIFATGLVPGLQDRRNPLQSDPREVGIESKEIGRGPFGEFLGIIDRGKGHAPLLRYCLGNAVLVESLSWKERRVVRAQVWERPDPNIVVVPIDDADVLKAKGIERRGAARWPDTYTTLIQPGKEGATGPAGSRGYVVDQIEIPGIDRKIRPAGIAFSGPGVAVVVTFDGDLWKVSGLTAGSKEAVWRRIGAGLHGPLSVQVVDREIYVFTRTGIQKMVMGENGEVSEYVTVCDDFTQTADTRDFPQSFAPDGEGGFFFSKGGQQMPYRTPHGGRVLHVDKSGKVSVFAEGLRNAYICRNPKTGMITATDQQGHWVPATPVHVIEKGGYYGFKRSSPEGEKSANEPPVHPPLSWIPHRQAQSGIGQVWTRERGFGPLSDTLLMLDFFRPGLLDVDVETGVVLPLRIPLPAPVVKAAVNPADGMPYIAGFQVWGTASKSPAGLMRLRHTGAPLLHPEKIVYGKEGVMLRFNAPLKSEVVTAPGTWDVQCWNYVRSAKYGSGHFKLDGTPGQEYLAVRSAHLSKDGKAVFLDVPKMAVAMQMQVSWQPLSDSLPSVTDMAVFTPSELKALDLEAGGFGEIDFAELAKIAPLSAGAVTAGEISAARGEEIHSLYGCIACHSIDGSTEGKSGPSWKNVYLSERPLLGGGKVVADEAYLRDAILDPAKHVVKGYDPKDVGMPSYAGILPETDVESLVQFIKTLGSGGDKEWRKHVIQKPVLHNVPSAVANDWNGDGKMDVISSWGGKVVLYRAPDWKMEVIHTFKEGDSRRKPRKTCIHSCLMDVDGDGDMDFIGSNQTVFWLECPEDPFGGGPWKYRNVDDEICGTHCVITGDVNRDGKPDLIANSFRGEDETSVQESIVWLEVPDDPHSAFAWDRHVFADKDAPGGSHYMGFGDVNHDGRPDIAAGAKGAPFEGGEWFAWWEQSEKPEDAWKKHLLSAEQPGASNIMPADFDGDGHVDYFATRGHSGGVLVFRGPRFVIQEVDPEIAFPHSLDLADMDGDGDLDAVTCGKEADGIAVWYENDGKANFKKHVIARDQGSYDTRAVDMDGDGDLDVLIGGQASRNIVWLENPLK